METTEFTIRSDGDQIERDNWELLAPHIHHYEIVWRLLVASLRSPGSIYLRDGIDEVFEEFAMCHYTTYLNLARALAKIDASADDLKFLEEIWANMHRASEVAIKGVAAFRTIYKDCVMPRQNPAVNTLQLEKLEGGLKKYRNILHDPIMGTAKDQGVRLVPRRGTASEISPLDIDHVSPETRRFRSGELALTLRFRGFMFDSPERLERH
jgi:hypothetical protein